MRAAVRKAHRGGGTAMQNAILGAIIFYLICGVGCSVWMMYFFRPVSYRPAAWLVVVSFLTFMLLWPFIAVSAICYLIGHMYRIRTGEALPHWPQSWTERDVKIPSIAAPRRFPR
jgi:hypothetical protein